MTEKDQKKAMRAALGAADQDAITALCVPTEPREATLSKCFYARTHLEMLIKGNKEVYEVIKLFPSEKEFAKSLKQTIKDQKRLLKHVKNLTALIGEKYGLK